MHQIIRPCLRTYPLSGSAIDLLATWFAVLDMRGRPWRSWRTPG